MSDIVFVRNASAVSTLVFGYSAVSSTSQITIPASAAVGDLAVLVDFAIATVTAPSAVTPSGWDLRGTMSIGGDPARMTVLIKVLAAGEPGSTITGMDGNSSDQKVMFTFTPNAPISTYTVGYETAQASNGDPADQTVTANLGRAPLVVLGFAGCADAVGAFDVETPAFTAKTTQGNVIAGYLIYNSAQASHSIGMADLGTRNYLASCYIEVA